METICPFTDAKEWHRTFQSNRGPKLICFFKGVFFLFSFHPFGIYTFHAFHCFPSIAIAISLKVILLSAIHVWFSHSSLILSSFASFLQDSCCFDHILALLSALIEFRSVSCKFIDHWRMLPLSISSISLFHVFACFCDVLWFQWLVSFWYIRVHIYIYMHKCNIQVFIILRLVLLCFLFFLLLLWSCCLRNKCTLIIWSWRGPHNHHCFVRCFFWYCFLMMTILMILLLPCCCWCCYCFSFSSFGLSSSYSFCSSCSCSWSYFLLVINVLPFDPTVFVNYFSVKKTQKTKYAKG